MTDDRRYDEVSSKVSHNSYERDERPVTEQLVWRRSEPHQGACRGLELDLCESPNLPMWAVDHDRYRPDADRQLTEHLRHLRLWSDLHPGHDVITISVDLKERARSLRQFPRYLDATIDEHLGRDRLFTPRDLMGDASNLVAGAAAGWPTLGYLAGRFILCLSGDETTKRNYARANDRLCFADRRLKQGEGLPDSDVGDRVFVNVNATESWPWEEQVGELASRPGFVTRAYVVNDEHLWRRAIGAGVNLIATDKVRNHPWASVGAEPFAPLARPDPRA